MKHFKFLPIFLITLLISCNSDYKDLGDGLFADIQTNKGNIIIKFTHEATPVTVANFITLAEGNSPFVSDSLKGKKYYEGVIFHRVIKDFMIQGGDPTGTGGGNPGYKFNNETVDSLVHDRGVISMANAGPDTNGSQFFITHKEYPSLNGGYTVFGKVAKGMEVVDSIANTETKAVGNLRNKPVEDIVINAVKIVRNGTDARAFDAVQVMIDYFEGIAKKEEEKELLIKNFLKEVDNQKKLSEELPSGLKIYFLKKGNGEKPNTGSTIRVDYSGWLETNGILFDTSEKEIAEKFYRLEQVKRVQNRRKNPFTPIEVPYSQDAGLITGFKEGLLEAKIGDIVRIFVPSHLAYGTEGVRGVIQPNSNLIYDLKLYKGK